MRKIAYKIEDEAWEEQQAARRYNPAMVAVLKNGKRITLSAGRGDNIGIWKDQERYYVVCFNSRFPYFGIDEYVEEGGRIVNIANAFFQEDYGRSDFLESNHMRETSLGVNIRTLKLYSITYKIP